MVGREEGGEGVMGNKGGREGLMGSKGGREGLMGSKGGGGSAYLVEYKMTTTIASSSSSSLVSLPRLVAPSPNATRSRVPVWSFVVLAAWACLSFPLVAAGRRLGRGCHCRPCSAFTVIHLVFVGWPLAVLCWSLSLCTWLSSRSAVGVVFGSQGHLWWCG